jgi:hypothetical protein
MKHFFQQDTVAVGLVAGLGSIVLLALLLTAGLMIAGEPPMAHLSWYAGCFVAPLLIMRYYIKQQKSVVAKTLMTVLFFTFIPFMFILFRTHSITLK